MAEHEPPVRVVDGILRIDLPNLTARYLTERIIGYTAHRYVVPARDANPNALLIAEYARRLHSGRAVA